MVSSNACSSFSSQKYPHQEQDGLIRRIRSLNTQRRGFCIPFQVPMNPKYTILNQSHFEPTNKCHSQRSLASTSNLESIKKPLSKNRRLFRRCFPSALEHGNVAKIPSDHSTWIDFSKKLNAFYRFSRPHTVIGTVVGIISVSLLPVETMADLSPTFLVGLLKALIPSILMNIYVVGLNQLFDVEIDKVNKPDLPLASRDFSMRTGAAIVAICFFMSLAMGFMFQSPPLLCALLISFLLGSAYSIDLPFLRWKKHALLAATTIISVRALVVQFAFFAHMQKYVLGKPIVFTKPMVFATAFMCFFSAVIALFKDIPDLDGDRDFGIQSFTVRLGPKKVFWLCIYMLLMAYGTAVMVGACSSYTFNKLVTVLGHCTLACILWLRALSIDLTNKASVTSFYMFIWKLFYVEYFLIPFVR